MGGVTVVCLQAHDSGITNLRTRAWSLASLLTIAVNHSFFSSLGDYSFMRRLKINQSTETDAQHVRYPFRISLDYARGRFALPYDVLHKQYEISVDRIPTFI